MQLRFPGENILRSIPNVPVRVDDRLLAGKTCAKHLQTLQDVLQRLKDARARLRKRTCVFLAREVVYLGLKIDQNGIHPVSKKVKAIEEMPRPA